MAFTGNDEYTHVIFAIPWAAANLFEFEKLPRFLDQSEALPVYCSRIQRSCRRTKQGDLFSSPLPLAKPRSICSVNPLPMTNRTSPRYLASSIQESEEVRVQNIDGSICIPFLDHTRDIDFTSPYVAASLL